MITSALQLTKKEQARKRKLFLFLRKNFKQGKIKVADKLDENAIIMCSAVEDVDYREVNRFWELEGNKSYPRELNCYKCKRQVMLSNILFEMYNKAEKLKPKLLCGKCMSNFDNIKKMIKNK